MRKWIGTLAAALAAGLMLAPEAFASGATVVGGNRIVVAGQGAENNRVQVIRDSGSGNYTIIDAAGVTGIGTCANVNPTTVTCPGAGIRSIRVDAGNGNDLVALHVPTIPTNVRGNLNGGNGNDVLLGANADDDLDGGRSSDFLDGGGGADDLSGGRGRDTVTYANRTTPVGVTIGSGIGDDGNELDQSGARRDTVRASIEQVAGGAAGDTIIGDASRELLNGGPGDDLLIGGRGRDALFGKLGDDVLFGQGGRDLLSGGPDDDHLSGGRGSDLLRGKAGDDRLLGGADDDALIGGPGRDFLRGKKGVDAMFGKGGRDRINAKDGTRDRKINCGPPRKREKVKRDRKDPRPKNC